MTPSPIRIVHVVPNLTAGGAQRVAVHILSALDRSRFEPSAIVFRGPSDTDLEGMLAQRGIPVTFLGKRPGFDPRNYSRVFAALRRHRPDVVHTHMQVLLYCLPALKFLRTPTVHTVHNLAKHEVEWQLRSVQRLSFRLGVVPVAIARSVKTSVEKLYGLSNIPLILNGIPVREYASRGISRDAWRYREGFTPDHLLIFSAGRLSLQKNYALLLEAFARLHASHPQVRVVLAGAGAQESALRTRADHLGIRSKVKFLGLRDDIPEILGAMDIFALSSNWEGNPLCIMEAMAAGLPVVSTSVGGIPELIDSGKQGILVPSGQTRAMTDALTLLIADPCLRTAMGIAASRRAEIEFDVAKMAAAYATFYEDSLRRPSRERPYPSRPPAVGATDKLEPSRLTQN